MELRFRLLLTTFLLGAIHCQLGEMQTDNRQQNSKKYCGGQIGQALSAVCKGNYNTLKRVDTFPRPTQWDTMYGDAPAVDTSADFPYQSRSEATALMGAKRRKKRWGVYNECCEKSCTRDELASYCAASSKRRRR